MSQKTKFNYDDVYNYIKLYGCELLSKEYINAKQKLEIKCFCGNIYFTNFDSFKFKNVIRCKSCTNKLKSDKKRIKYEDVKNYIDSKGCKLISESVNSAVEKLIIQCSCGEIFHRSFNKFKSQNQTKCLKCQNITNWDYKKIKEFVKNESECELISNNYVNRLQKLIFRCKCGNNFETSFHSFLYSNKRQCEECRCKIVANKNKNGIDYLKEYTLKNSNCILTSNNYKDYYEKLEFKCECGNIFKASFLSFINGKKQCNICSKTSKMENTVEKIFIKNNIKYNSQYTFLDLRGVNGGLLRFDFCVKNDKNDILFLLELDGEQHFKPISYFGGSKKFLVLKEHDKLKEEYCLKNNIFLFRISFYEKDKIQNIVNDLICKHVNPVPSLI